MPYEGTALVQVARQERDYTGVSEAPTAMPVMGALEASEDGLTLGPCEPNSPPKTTAAPPPGS